MPVATLLAAFAAALMASPAAAEFLPRPEEIAAPGEERLLQEIFLPLLEAHSTDAAAMVAKLDDALAQINEPTKLRGFVQYLRAHALRGAEMHRLSREAAEESVRLLPGYSGPLLLASSIYAYGNEPDRAADYLLRASQADPDLVSRMPEYELNAILHRLQFQRDQRRLRALSERLIEIGWVAQSLDRQSALVRYAIEARIAEDDLDGAKALVPRLLSPRDSRLLLAQYEYRALWPTIEAWAGPQLHDQWQVYLAEAQARWEASRDSAAAAGYVRALADAGHHDTIIREMLPEFLGSLDAQEDFDLMFVAASLADAFARKGRWADINAMYAAAAAAWPLGSDANALNIAANRARFIFYEGRTEDGLEAIDAAIADASERTVDVNRDALLGMQQSRACMLHALGRDDQSLAPAALASSQQPPVARANLFLCLGKPDTAREILVGALDSDVFRGDVIEYVQGTGDLPIDSEYGRFLHAQGQALRSDPALLQAVAKHGRVLPFTLRDGAPPELGSSSPL